MKNPGTGGGGSMACVVALVAVAEDSDVLLPPLVG